MEQYATYCPEDDKIRLYVGRVPREEYEKLRAEGWTCTPKQDCNFVAVWTPQRRDTALHYSGGIILDEDQSPEDRAADRAERFGGYRDKRTSEAVGHADKYDAGPAVHGFQSQAKAERSAARHDRIGSYAVDAWSKAEYWQQRTAGVISHALHKSTPSVRMGRIKTIEADLRKQESNLAEVSKKYNTWKKIAAMTDPDKQTALAKALVNAVSFWREYPHPITGKMVSLYSLLHNENAVTGAQAAAIYMEHNSEPAQGNDWTNHLKLRLAYENQMLEAQGGRAAFVEMVAGGWIGDRQIRKVNKSPATGRVVSVTLKIKGARWGDSQEGFHLQAFNIERLPADAYTPPTEADLAELAAEKNKEKAAAPKKAPCPIVNLTDADAERLQKLWNEEAEADYKAGKLSKYMVDFEPSTVRRITQATFSANAHGTFSRASVVELVAGGKQKKEFRALWGAELRAALEKQGPAICKVRVTYGNGNTSNKADSVIILTDKPQKPLPAAVWEVMAEEVTA